MSQELLPELFKQPTIDFKQHLAIENNERIIFSGKFGHGKTTFINHFFNDETQKENYGSVKYNVISLCPVNYSIASNEDIFKYIKYDIILNMLAKNYNVEPNVVGYLETLPEFLKRNSVKVLAGLIYMIPHVGKNVVECYEKLEPLMKDFFEYHDNSNGSPLEALADYMDSVEKSEGNIFEDDIVTQLITRTLADQKSNSESENILVVDDLDRIDPEHIFRILNVFAAHFDRRNILKTKNKFGFDKIVLVCDIENIRNIFKTKYGIDTDFNGYVDKFYSNRIFHFNNRKEISALGKKLFWNVRWRHVGNYGHGEEELNRIRQGVFFQGIEAGFFIDMLDLLFFSGELDLRNILKMKSLPITYIQNTIVKEKYFEEEKYKILLYLRLLAVIKGDHHSLIDAFKKAKNNILGQQKRNNYARELIRIMLIGDINYSDIENDVHQRFTIRDTQIEIRVAKNKDIINQSIDLFSTTPNTIASHYHIDDEHFLWLVQETIHFLASQGHFNYQ